MDTGFEAGPCSLGVLIQLRGVIFPSVWTQPWVPMTTGWAPLTGLAWSQNLDSDLSTP